MKTKLVPWWENVIRVFITLLLMLVIGSLAGIAVMLLSTDHEALAAEGMTIWDVKMGPESLFPESRMIVATSVFVAVMLGPGFVILLSMGPNSIVIRRLYTHEIKKGLPFIDDKRYLLGEDSDGVTALSLEALLKIFENGGILEKVEIGPNGPGTICSFIFKDHGVYNASGFNVGYGGEGPHGLHTALIMFCPDNIEKDFYDTPISSLDREKSWNWMPKRGFVSAE